MEQDFQYDVFLSHGARDKAAVPPLAERFRKNGLKVWFDEWALKPGDSIPAQIEEVLERSRYFTVVGPVCGPAPIVKLMGSMRKECQ